VAYFFGPPCICSPVCVTCVSDFGYTHRHRPHHCRSAVHGCRLTATELLLSPLPAPGTIAVRRRRRAAAAAADRMSASRRRRFC